MSQKIFSFSSALMSLVVALTAAACSMKNVDDAALAESSLVGNSWYVEYIHERPVIDRSPAYFLFDKNGTLRGNASCNQFVGKYELSHGQVTLSELATTRRVCIESLGEQERRFLSAVSDVAKWKIERGLLLLLSARGEIVFQSATHARAKN
ncbi:META domain-containing protein [Halieaceae bacterium IMCC11814]|uniref:META domain-containing protein n=2 Tax=Candidatus Marimicrobium litorale TaxID=2518991 RepID=A0ABT3T9U7_9GAMM|nr:META domain-containing protein [Candidatus Marimicrobium litorale]